jgi:hypothetical protein
MGRESPNSVRWPFYLTSAFLFGATLLRSVLLYLGRAELWPAVGLLLGWLALFALQALLARRWAWFFWVYLAAQASITALLLTLPVFPDYFSVLFAVLAMQIRNVVRCAPASS